MYYILCEGAVGKAEYTFCKKIAEEFSEKAAYSIFSASGNRNIFGVFEREIYPALHSQDCFILFFDCILSSKDFEIYSLLEDIDEYCKEKNTIFQYTTYYCFEELFLSYDGLLKLSKEILDVNLYDTLEQVNQYIMSGINYFKLSLPYNAKLNQFYPKSISTREKYAKALLHEVTYKLGRTFLISESKIGDCWVEDCSNVTEHKVKTICSKCKHPCKNCTFREKIMDIDRHSISATGLQLSTIFNKV